MIAITRPDWLSQRAAINPNGSALIHEDKAISFGELLTRARSLASELASSSIAPGQRIGLLMDNGPLFVECLHALMQIGAVCVPLNPRLRPKDLEEQLSDAGASSLLADAGQLDTVAQMEDGRVAGLERSRDLRIKRLCREDACTIEEREGETPTSNDVLHTIIFTSGTTGRSKGVELTYGNHWWNAMGSMMNLGSLESDVWLCCLGPYHVGGLSILLRSVLYGVPAMLHSRFDPEAVNQALDSGGVTMVSLVSTMLHRMLEQRGYRPYPSRLRCILLGGGPIPTTLIEACLDAGIPIAPTYGLTETASQAATLKPGEVGARCRGAGRPLFGVEMRIDPDEPGSDPFPPGEILVRGPSVFRGYCNASAERSESGWFRTGDVGMIDDEGYLSVLDRASDRIVTGGENVYPSEIESVLDEHPAILEACVFGVADVEWGERVEAAVIPRTERLEAEDVLAYCRDRLSGFKCPKRIHLVDSLPRGASGKLLRKELRRQVMET